MDDASTPVISFAVVYAVPVGAVAPTTGNVVAEVPITYRNVSPDVLAVNVTFAVPGAVFPLECISQGVCKASVPFLHVVQIIKDSRVKETEIIITKGNLKINGVTISVKTTFLEDDNILRTIDLPINYTEADLIRLSHNGYTYEELEFNNLHSKIDDALYNLDDNIFKAYKLLSQYGIDFSVLKEMVHDKLFSKNDN